MCKYTVIKEHNAISFHNYIESLINYYNYPKVDVIITSPPYNIGVKYAGYDDNQPKSIWMDTIIHSLYPTDKITNDGALMYMNIKPSSSDTLSSLNDIIFIVTAINELSEEWEMIQEIVWVIPNKQHINQFKIQNRFSNYKEYLFLYGKKSSKINRALIGEELTEEYLNDKRYKKTIEKYIKKFGRAYKDVGDVWVIPILKYNKHTKRFNPAEYPPQLVEAVIKSHPDYGKRTLTVYDPFVGGGTTAYVAHNLGCNYYVCDISKTSVNTTKRRIKRNYTEFYNPKIHNRNIRKV